MFSPGLGRWLQNDPIGYDGEDPNLYRFAGNQPTSSLDPFGLTTIQKVGDLSLYRACNDRPANVVDHAGLYGFFSATTIITAAEDAVNNTRIRPPTLRPPVHNVFALHNLISTYLDVIDSLYKCLRRLWAIDHAANALVQSIEFVDRLILASFDLGIDPATRVAAAAAVQGIEVATRQYV